MSRKLCSIATIVILLSFSLAFSVLAQNKGTISGKVTVAESGEPLPGANVIIVGTLRGASTNLDGEYHISINPGVYTLRASFIGYSPAEKEVRVNPGETVTVDFALSESALQVGEELVVLGSRTARTAVETPVPVDVITDLEVRHSGQAEVNQILTYLAPSFNASHQTIADGTDHINPASLRGLGPDQVLVLINGKRRHTSALVHVNGTFGRGTVGVDLNAIPVSAIERIEILRDGAAAQYGSDAIAGVINIVLKEQTSSIQTNTLVGVTGEGDGEEVKQDVNFGFKIGERGYFNVTAEFLNREPTNRSSTYTGPIFFPNDPQADEAELRRRGLTRDDFSMKIGQSKAVVGATFFNTMVPLSENAEFYAFGGFSHRKGRATGFYRLPYQEARVNLNVYPNGFLPEIHTEIVDRALTAGISGTRNGWDIDMSITHGGNSFQFNIENSLNASMGESSPTSFDAGQLRFSQTVGNLDLVRLIDTGGKLKSLSLVLGSEFRVENYRIIAGEEASWQLGNGGDRPGIDFDTTSTGAPKNPGSQVFPGFQPSNEVNRYRNSIAVYAGLESNVTDRFMLDVGGRFENYSDFGSTVNGKVAARFEVAPNFALRGAVSTGFRAPSLHQVWFNNVSIQFLLDPATGQLEPKRVLTGNNRSAITKAFGVPDLKEETSLNVSAGFTAKLADNLRLTVDGYMINIDDRIVLSSRFSAGHPTIGPVVAEILKPFAKLGVSQAQFFANAVDTETRGLDIVASYAKPMGDATLSITAAANFTKTQVVATNVPAEMVKIFREIEGREPTAEELESFKTTLFNREERNRLEDALPRKKFTLGLRYATSKLQAVVRATYFGEIYYKPTNPANDEVFSAKTIFDVDLAYEVMKGVRLSVGANNLFNTFPDKQTKPANISSGRFPYSRRVTQFGMNGGFYYTRLSLDL